jgi:2-(1,2-epoxy-1,2-dihydrophenyl)acetyl-CoA isomerase
VAGSAKARELLFFADVLSAADAHAAGLVNDVFPDDQLMAEVGARAARLAAKAPLALAGLKANLNDAEHLDISRHLEVESERLVRVMGTEDRVEAGKAFFEKRPAIFKGR